MSIKLLNIKSKELVDFEPKDVNAAIDSGEFAFAKNRGVPVQAKGEITYVTPKYASQYRDRLLFVNDEDVERSKAEEKTAGLGGAVKALGYGAFKSGTLGVGPLLAGAVSDTAAETFRELELGRPGLTAIGELGGLAFDPFAAAGKVGQRIAARGAAQTAERAAAQAARGVSPELRLGEAAVATPPAQTAVSAAGQVAGTGAQRAIAREVSPAAGAAQAVIPTEAELANAATLATIEREQAAQRAARSFEAREGAMARAAETGESAISPFGAVEGDPFRSQAMAGEAARQELALGAPVDPTAALRMAERQERLIIADTREALRGTRRMPRSLRESAQDTLLPKLEEAQARLAEIEATAEGRVATEALDIDRIGAVSPGMGQMAETAIPRNVSPDLAFGERIGGLGERGVSGAGVPLPSPSAVSAPGQLMAPVGRMAETTVQGSALRLGQAPAETLAALGDVAAPAAASRGLSLAGVGRAAAEGGIYGAASQAQRQQLGLEEGGAAEIAKAGLLGAAIPAGLIVGGRAAAPVAAAAGAGAKRAILPMLKTGLERVEETHILRTMGIDKGTIERLNRKFSVPELEKRGTAAFADFAKNELDDIAAIKANARNADNAFLQSIPDDAAFRKLSPEQKVAFAQGVVNKYGTQYDNVFAGIEKNLVDMREMQRIVDKVESMKGPLTQGAAIESVKPELDMLKAAIADGRPLTLEQLHNERTRIGEIFEGRQGANQKWTEAQQAIYQGLRDMRVNAAEAAKPGSKSVLDMIDAQYEIAKMLQKGTERVAAGTATQSPVGRDLLAQFALGAAAMGHPVAAAKFFLSTVGLRYLYNQRGEGIIADVAGRLASNIAKNPVKAAEEVAPAILNASRPMLLGYNAERLVETDPKDYSAMVRSVRELQATRNEAMDQLRKGTSNLPPEEQQAALDNLTRIIDSLSNNAPKGIPTGTQLSSEEKNYAVYARSMLDPVYATQVIVNGGAPAQEAARGIGDAPGGREYLTKLADTLRDQIASSPKLRGNETVLRVARNVRRAAGGGGIASGKTLFPQSPAFKQDIIGKTSASTQANAMKAFGTASTLPR